MALSRLQCAENYSSGARAISEVSNQSLTVGDTGIEPVTSAMSTLRSSQLS